MPSRNAGKKRGPPAEAPEPSPLAVESLTAVEDSGGASGRVSGRWSTKATTAARAAAHRVLRARAFGIVCIATLFAVAIHYDGLRWVSVRPESLGAPVGVLVEEDSRPGRSFNRSAIVCRRPFVAMPGFVTTALEAWEVEPCAMSGFSTNFRKQLFGGAMLLTLLEDPECFFRHAALDPVTAGDPPGIKLRPADGLSSIDYVAPGFWVWAKIFRNLADVGYSPRDIVPASFDWRLSPPELEDIGYFEQLKDDVERSTRRSARRRQRMLKEGDADVDDAMWEAEGCGRVVIAAHSYGTPVINAFLEWAEALEPGWTDAHVHAVAHVGGPTLGMPKAAAALLSGEFRDTAVLPLPVRSLVDRSLPRLLRTFTFRTWPCLLALLPRGGASTWPHPLTLRTVRNDTVTAADGPGEVNQSLTETRMLMSRAAIHSGNERLAVRTQALAGAAAANVETARSAASRMPTARRVAVYCFYGVNRPTEVGYSYVIDADDLDTLKIDSDRADFGVHMGSGDGTVPLVSLGYACRSAHGYRASAGRVVTVEFDEMHAEGKMDAEEVPESEAASTNAKKSTKSAASGVAAAAGDGYSILGGVLGGAARYTSAVGLFASSYGSYVSDAISHQLDRIGIPDPRGGVTSSDHVDLMGNHELVEAILKLATTSVAAQEAAITDRIFSNIDAIVARLDTGST